MEQFLSMFFLFVGLAFFIYIIMLVERADDRRYERRLEMLKLKAATLTEDRRKRFEKDFNKELDRL